MIAGSPKLVGEWKWVRTFQITNSISSQCQYDERGTDLVRYRVCFLSATVPEAEFWLFCPHVVPIGARRFAFPHSATMIISNLSLPMPGMSQSVSEGLRGFHMSNLTYTKIVVLGILTATLDVNLQHVRFIFQSGGSNYSWCWRCGIDSRKCLRTYGNTVRRSRSSSRNSAIGRREHRLASFRASDSGSAGNL